MIKEILVAVDLEDAALTKKVLQIAGEIAGLHSSRVTLIHVGAELPADVAIHLPSDFQHQMSTKLVNQLEEMAQSLNLPPDATRVSVRHGPIYREILAQAKADDTDLIVIGCHKPDAADFLLGSNAARVSRHATCSVYVVR
jgi:universal stress protein G